MPCMYVYFWNFMVWVALCHLIQAPDYQAQTTESRVAKNLWEILSIENDEGTDCFVEFRILDLDFV